MTLIGKIGNYKKYNIMKLVMLSLLLYGQKIKAKNNRGFRVRKI